MALSSFLRRVLAVGLACQDGSKELCDAVDAGTVANAAGAAAANVPTLAGPNTMAGVNTFSGSVVANKLELGPAPADTFGASMTIDVTKSLHVIAASHTASATVTLTPSAAGTAGDVLVILTEADSSGTVTATFGGTFHSSGTQASTLSTFSGIVFVSDGTRWVELCRTTALA